MKVVLIKHFNFQGVLYGQPREMPDEPVSPIYS